MTGLTSSSLLIRQANVLLSDGTLKIRDVLVRQGAIAKVAPEITVEGASVIDAEGLTLLPGVIDPQVHFREPGLEHKEDLPSADHAPPTLEKKAQDYPNTPSRMPGVEISLPLLSAVAPSRLRNPR